MKWSQQTKREFRFDDLDEFWRYAMVESNAKQKGSREINEKGWSGVRTWDDAKYLALNGWPQGLQEIEKYRSKLTPFVVPKVMRRVQNYNVAGFGVDVGAYLANQPEHFYGLKYEEAEAPGRIYTIVSSISFSSAIKPQTIIKRGAMICSLIDAIEYAGHRAEVVINWVSSKDRKKRKKENAAWFEVDVVVKKANQPVDLSELAFCLAHPAMLRRIMFSMAEREGWSDYIRNYGYPGEASNQGDIYVKEIFSRDIPDAMAVSWVLEELRKLGIEVEESDDKRSIPSQG